jgi:indole-3-glycerol phosphate synthase
MILDEIVADKRKRLVEHKERVSPERMKELALASGRKSVSFYDALAKDGLSIIGEFKKASPSLGVIANKLELTDRIEQYNASVDAISCLTEEDHFHGNVEYLKQIRGISPLPVLRKDFVIDEYQIYEAKVIGADAVLLIAAILTDEDMKRFYELAYSLGLDVLCEVHDEEEMDRALSLGARIVGVNNRNLKDFTISLDTTKRLVTYMERKLDGRERPVFVSESGVTETEHIEFLKQYRVNALLIGRAFMEAEHPEALAKEWKQVYDSKN